MTSLVEVIRNGNATAVPKKDIVVGDIVLLTTGAEVPADGKLLEAVSLSVDESTLTGESVFRKKSTNEEDLRKMPPIPQTMCCAVQR